MLIEPIFIPMYLPPVALIVAFYLRARRKNSAGATPALHPVRFFFLASFAGVLGYFVGLSVGTLIACRLATSPGNLCGLYGFFFSGPISAAIVIILAALYLTKRVKHTPDEK